MFLPSVLFDSPLLLFVVVLENMPGQAGTIGGSFLELRRIINRIKDKSRIGICLDTCHAFAAGQFKFVGKILLES